MREEQDCSLGWGWGRGVCVCVGGEESGDASYGSLLDEKTVWDFEWDWACTYMAGPGFEGWVNEALPC